MIVSSNAISRNKNRGDFVGLAVTSKLHQGQYAVQVDPSDLESGNLPKRSEVRCDKICTISKRLIAKKLCHLNKTAFSTVKAKLAEVFE